MSRTLFFDTSTSNDAKNPLLNHESSLSNVSLRDLSPRASPSPPPSFYRDMQEPSERTEYSSVGSGSRDRDGVEYGKQKRNYGNGKGRGRRIQFAAPPPPITASVVGLRRGTGVDGSNSVNGSRSGSLGRRKDGRAGSTNVGRRDNGRNDLLLGLERRERAIQGELQELLDAQSAGLVKGFGGEDGGRDREESGSSTPTTRSLQRERETNRGIKGIVPVRQPRRTALGLRAARKGLLRDMGELADIKGEEGNLLVEEIERREECIEKVKDWKKRIEEVRKEIGEFIGAGITSSSRENLESYNGTSEEDREIVELRTEEKAVEMEIRETEDRLLQMRARKNWLGERIKERVNKRESRLSSYRGALREVEGEVQEFLNRPPVTVSVVMGDEEGFMALPPKRRTLEMAEEWWNKEIEHLRRRKGEVEKEKGALEEGAELWKECIDVVVAFEDDLRRQMKSGEAQDISGLRKQVGKMGKVIEKLGETVKGAEEKGWNLLVCAVGAELAAFREGEEILKGALRGTDLRLHGGGDGAGREQKLEQGGDGVQDVRGDNARDRREERNDDTTDDALKELEHDLAREEQLLGNGRASIDREESDEEKHLNELFVDHGAHHNDDGY